MNQKDTVESLPESTTSLTQQGDLDALDASILDLLRKNGRIPSARIARELGVPEATVRYRIKRLTSKGYVVFVALTDLAHLGKPLLAVFLVKTVPRMTLEFVEQLAELSCTRHIVLASGTFDVFIQAAFRDRDEFLDFRYRVLGQSPAVTELESVEMVKTLHRTYEWSGDGIGVTSKKE